MNEAVRTLMETLVETRWRALAPAQEGWARTICGLILALEPQEKTHQVLDALPYRTEGVDKADTLNTMANMGYFARPTDLVPDDIELRLCPCLFIPEEDTDYPWIILGELDGALQIFDSINGEIRTASQEDKQQKGAAWFFQAYDESTTNVSKFMRAGTGFGWFRALISRFSGTFWQVMAAGFILNLVALSTPLFIMLVYDRVIAVGSLETLDYLVVGVMLAIITETALRFIRSRSLSWLAARLDNIVGNRIFEHLMGLVPSYIERASVAAQIARIKTFESVRDFFSGAAFLSLLEFPFMIIALLAIMAIAGPLAWVPVGMALLYTALFVVMRRRIKVAIRAAAKMSSARQQFSIETFEKMDSIRGNGLMTVWQTKFRELSGRENLAHFHLNWLGIVSETCANALTLLAGVVTIGMGAHLIWAGSISTGALVATMILVWRVLTPFYSLCTMIPRLEQLRNSIIQVNALIDLDTEIATEKAAARLPRLNGRVTFGQAGMRYAPEDDPVISNISVEARPGDIVAITGSNGSGKSTILKMIKGLYRAQSGTVRIDGFDIRQLNALDLRRQIAYVPQNPDFFSGTVIENLRIGNPLASRADIEKALKLADALDDVLAMPQGMDTPVNARTAQRLPSSLFMRLSLARAYLHDGRLMLIDELPNTLLSGRTGQNLKDYIVRAKGQRTIFIVTYREDIMRLADTIMVLHRNHPPLVGPRETMLDTLQEVA